MVILTTLLAAFTQWQPGHSVDLSNQALELLASNPRAAHLEALNAVHSDPLSVHALFTLSAVQRAEGRPQQARKTLLRAVELQPSNPETWQTLGEYDLHTGDSHNALRELGAAIYLNPETIASEATIANDPELLSVRNDYLLALRQAQPARALSTGSALPAFRGASGTSRLSLRR